MFRIPLIKEEEAPNRRSSIRGRTTLENSFSQSGLQTPTSQARYSRAATNLKKLAANNFIKEQAMLERQLPYAERLKKTVKSPHRSYEDAKFLYEDLQFTPFVQTYLSADEYDEATVVEVFKNLKYEFFSKGSIIIREGDDSNNKAYILISGSISIYRKKETFFSQQAKENERQEEAQIEYFQNKMKGITNPLKLDTNELNTSMSHRNKLPGGTTSQANSHHGTRRNSINDDNKPMNASIVLKEAAMGSSSHLASKHGSKAPSQASSRRGSINDNFYLPSSNEILTLPSSPPQNKRKSLYGTLDLTSSPLQSAVPLPLILPSPASSEKPPAPAKSKWIKKGTNLSDKPIPKESPKNLRRQPSNFSERRADSARGEPRMLNVVEAAVLHLKKYSNFHHAAQNEAELLKGEKKKTSESNDNALNVSQAAMSNLLRLSKRDRSSDSDEMENLALLGQHLKDIEERGDVFGQVALEDDTKRTATIYAKEDVEVLTITKNYYTSIGKKHRQKMHEQSNFIVRLIPGLDQVVSEDSTREMMRAFKLHDYRRHHTPMIEGETEDEILVVYEGEVKLIKTVMIEIDDTGFDGPTKVTKLFRKKRYDKEEIVIAHHGKGAIFGEEILLSRKNEKAPYQYSLRVETESAHIFRVSRSSLKMQFPMETLREMRQIYLEKKDERDSELIQELSKRSLEIVSDDISTLPLIVKRMPLKLLQQKSPKINLTIGKVNSLAVLASKNDERYLQKTIPLTQRSDEESDQRTFESYRNFSRYKFLPQTYDQREEDIEIHPENFSSREVLHHRKRHHYLSSHAAPKNIDDFLENYEKKFKIVQKQKAEHRKIHDIKRFKLNFASNEEVLLAAVIERQKKAMERKEYELNNQRRIQQQPLTQRVPKFKKYYLPKLKESPIKSETVDSTYQKPSIVIDEVLKLPDLTTQPNEYQIQPLFSSPEPGGDISTLRRIMRENSNNIYFHNDETPREKKRDIVRIEPKGNKYTDKNNLKKLVAKAKSRYADPKIRISETWDISNVNTSTLGKSSMVQGELFYLLGQPNTAREKSGEIRLSDKFSLKHNRLRSDKI